MFLRMLPEPMTAAFTGLNATDGGDTLIASDIDLSCQRSGGCDNHSTFKNPIRGQRLSHPNHGRHGQIRRGDGRYHKHR